MRLPRSARVRLAAAGAVVLVSVGVIVAVRQLSGGGEGPIAQPRVGGIETQAGISSSLTPGRTFDWAEVPLENTGESPATVRSVELVNGSSPAPVRLVEARALPAGRSPDGGVMKAGSDRKDWQVDPIPAEGAVVPGVDDPGGELGLMLLLTVGPTANGITWVRAVDVTYEVDGREYTDRFYRTVTFCSEEIAEDDCDGRVWKYDKSKRSN